MSSPPSAVRGVRNRAPATSARSRQPRGGPATRAATRRSRDDCCSTRPANCSPARTTAAPRPVRSPRLPASASICCSATSARRPDCSGKPWCCRSPASSTSFGKTWQAVVPEETDEEELSRQFVGQLYDVLVEHQGLLLTLVASDGLSDEEIEEAGIADIRRALAVLGQISAEGMSMRGMRSSQPDCRHTRRWR